MDNVINKIKSFDIETKYINIHIETAIALIVIFIIIICRYFGKLKYLDNILTNKILLITYICIMFIFGILDVPIAIGMGILLLVLMFYDKNSKVTNDAHKSQNINIVDSNSCYPNFIHNDFIQIPCDKKEHHEYGKQLDGYDIASSNYAGIL